MNNADREILPLLSGWLDGELSVEETQRVEKALKRSAALRAVVDEWRSVDQTLSQQEAVRSEGEWEALALRVEGAIAAEASKEDVASRGTRTTPHAASWAERLQSWFGTRTWAVGGSSALAAIVLLVLLWPNSDELLRSTGVVDEQAPPSETLLAEPKAPREKREKKDTTAKAVEPSPTQAPDLVAHLKKDASGNEQALRSTSPSAPPVSSAPTASDAPMASAAPKASGAGPAPSPPAVRGASEAEDTPGAAVFEDGKLLKISGRSREAEVRIDSVEESLQDSGKRETDRDLATPDARLALPQPQRSQEGGVVRRFSAMNRNDDWLGRMNRNFNAALAAESRDDLQNIIEEVNRYRAETPASQSDVGVLGLALRTRSEFLKLFPDEAEQGHACETLHADYALYQSLADQTILESSEGLRLRNLMGEICPE